MQRTSVHTILKKHSESSRYFNAAPISLNALVISAGFMKETLPRYNWDGLKRGNERFVLFQYTVAGRGRLRWESAEYDVHPGTAMVLWFPHNNRYWLPTGSKSWEFIYVCLSGNEIFRIWQELVSSVGPIAALASDAPPIIAASEIISRMSTNLIRQPFESSRLAYDLTMKLAQELLVAAPARQEPRGIAEARDLAQTAVGAQITVADMAGRAGYSRFHFSRLFVASGGVSPGEYVRQQRMNQAIALLRTTRQTIKEIAATCGFCDATYFSKAFKKATGLAPLAFRRSDS